MYTFTCFHFPNILYRRLVQYCYHNGSQSEPRGFKTRELCNVMMEVLTPCSHAIETGDEKRDAVMLKYHAAESDLYRRQVREAAVWGKEASKFWLSIQNPDGTINSNYEHLTKGLRDVPQTWENAMRYYELELEDDYISQWEWAKTQLLRDPDTRQAVMHFNRPQHQWFGNRDFPCTMYGNFQLRDFLNYTVHMRSQDLVKGFPYDMPFFCRQLFQMGAEIEQLVGRVTLVVDSLHLYEKDYETYEPLLS